MRKSQLFPPADDLKRFVRGYFIHNEAGQCGAISKNHLPSVVYPSLTLILRGNVQSAGKSGKLQALPAAFFIGATTRPIVSANIGSVLSVCFLFHPGALPYLLPERPVDLIDVLTSAQDLWPGETAALTSRIEGLLPGQAIPVIEEFIRGLLRYPRRHPGFNNHTSSVTHALSHLPLSEVVSRSGISLRQFERRFLAQYGMTPKLFQRLRRFERAVYTLRDAHLLSEARLANIAAECGYFDQPHFNKDFRQFSGMSPIALLDYKNPGADEYWSYRVVTPRHSVP